MSETQTSRVTVTLTPEETELFKRLKAFTGLSPAQAIQKLLPSHLEELWAYLAWLEKLSERPTNAQKLGPYLLQSYGPETLIQGIKHLDPTYETEGEKFVNRVNDINSTTN